MTKQFHYLQLDGRQHELQPGKIIAVGRNYHAHIEELKNPLPDQPVIFMKPATALCHLEQAIIIPQHQGAVHYEIELAALIAHPISRTQECDVPAAIGGYALALDLTLRDIQDDLKSQGLPWEMAKAWDGSCPLGRIIPADIIDPHNAELKLLINEEVRQQANTNMMIRGVTLLISYISHYFTLMPGDLVLTGTPAGVGPLHAGDALHVALDKHTESTQIIVAEDE